MKKIIILVSLSFLIISCKTVKESQYCTVERLMLNLVDNNPEYILDNILLKGTKGVDRTTIEFDCKKMKEISDKYGIPDTSDYIYTLLHDDIVDDYLIEVVFFEGVDTLNFSVISKVSLKAFFGPLEYNNPNRIREYRIEIDREKSLGIDTTSKVNKLIKEFDDLFR